MFKNNLRVVVCGGGNLNLQQILVDNNLCRSMKKSSGLSGEGHKALVLHRHDYPGYAGG